MKSIYLPWDILQLLLVAIYHILGSINANIHKIYEHNEQFTLRWSRRSLQPTPFKGKKGIKGVIGAFQRKERRERHQWSFSKGK
jgi:hypothetical protein